VEHPNRASNVAPPQVATGFLQNGHFVTILVLVSKIAPVLVSVVDLKTAKI
jgi:hypothetical protein